MKLLIHGLNYAPELTGIGKYTAEMAESFFADGHDVRVVCAPPYYPEWRVHEGFSPWRYRSEHAGGVRVTRVPLWVPARPSGAKRLLHLASFALACAPAFIPVAWWRPDVVVTIAPSLAGAPFAWLLARITGAACWLHIQDFEVDAAFELGLLKSARAKRMALAIERFIMRRFDVVSTISTKMAEHAQRKGVERVMCVPNWVDTDAIRPLMRASVYRNADELGLAPGQTVVLYAGNMGAKQGLEVLAQAAAALVHRADITFVFCGSGPMQPVLAARCASLPNCRFMPLQPAARLNELLNLADIHVLPQRGDAADLVMPSKLTGMLASGRAIVAMACAGTELFEVVEPRGVVVPPEDPVALVAAIEALAADPERRARLGVAAREYAQRQLSAHAVLGELVLKLRLLRGDAHDDLAITELPRDAARASAASPASATSATSAASDEKREVAPLDAPPVGGAGGVQVT